MICDFELLILLISNFCIVGLIFGLILETVFVVQHGFASLPSYILVFYATFMMEHLILFMAATKKNLKLALIFMVLRGLSVTLFTILIICFGAIYGNLTGEEGKLVYGAMIMYMPGVGVCLYIPVLLVAVTVFCVSVKYFLILRKRKKIAIQEKEKAVEGAKLENTEKKGFFARLFR